MKVYALPLAALGVGLVLATGAVASAEVVTLFDTMDVGLAKEQSGTTQSGMYGFMNADIGGMGTERRFLMQWDLSGVPAGSTITSANLRVYTVDDSTGYPFSVYRMTQSWVEGWGGSNGGPVQLPTPQTAAGANWVYRDCSDTNTAWTTPGGDFDVASRVQFTPTTPSMRPDVTAIVQSWVDGTPNYGVIIATDETAYARHAMVTREFGINVGNGQDVGPCPGGVPGTYAPQLIIDYSFASGAHITATPGAGPLDMGIVASVGPSTTTNITLTSDSGTGIAAQVNTVSFSGTDASLFSLDSGAGYTSGPATIADGTSALYGVKFLGTGVRDTTYSATLKFTTNAGEFVYALTATTASPHMGDANMDGKVDLQDFSLLKAYYNQTLQPWNHGNFNNDAEGKVNLEDFSLLKAHYNHTGDGSTLPVRAIPEPASLALLLAGAIGFLRRRGRRCGL